MRGAASGSCSSACWAHWWPPCFSSRPVVGAVALLWFLAGASNSLLTLGGSSYMTRAADPRRLGVLSALYALSGTLGGALGSPAAGRVLDTRGYSAYGLAGTSMLFVTLLFALFLAAPPAGRARRAPAGACGPRHDRHQPEAGHAHRSSGSASCRPFTTACRSS